jgi:ABC-2 type transport system permease protein
LLGRNRLALLYAVLMPLTPLFILLTNERGDLSLGVSAIGGVLLLAGLFPVYYNVLGQFVSRREELVLKRMRTGEVRDSELLIGIALPGLVCALVTCAAGVPVAIAAGQPVPVNLFLLDAGTSLSLVMFAALAYWTAAWTRSAEAAQLTSMPVIILAAVGPLGVMMTGLSGPVRVIIGATPGAALTELVRAGWFGFDGDGATTRTLSFAGSWAPAVPPMLVMALWTVGALLLARRSLRWEPRS